MSGYSYSSTQYQCFHRPLPLTAPLYLLREYQVIKKETKERHTILLPIIEQHGWCVASISRRHRGSLHQTFPHNESKVTSLAVYGNILFYKLDEASSNAVSSEGWIVAKCFFSCCCRSSALAKTHNILSPVYTCWQVVSILPLYKRVNTFLDELDRLVPMIL